MTPSTLHSLMNRPMCPIAVLQVLLPGPGLGHIAAGAVGLQVSAGQAVQGIVGFRHVIPEEAGAGTEIVHHHGGPALLHQPDEGHVVYLAAPDEEAGEARRLRPGARLDLGDGTADEFQVFRRRQPIPATSIRVTSVPDTRGGSDFLNSYSSRRAARRRLSVARPPAAGPVPVSDRTIPPGFG